MPLVAEGWRGPGWRTASVWIWTPVLLIAPVLDLGGGPGRVTLQVALLLAVLGAALVAARVGGPPWLDLRARVALAVLALAVVVGAGLRSSQWLPTWVLLANALPTAVRGRVLAGAVAATGIGSGIAAAAVAPLRADRVAAEVLVVVLAGVAAASLATLVDTVAELRRTQQDLARAAVVDERERFARDLHDLLGHTLSVVVVKAQAVRRLAASDPEAAAGHATDIEQVGRRALTDVRQAVDAMRAPRLDEEVAGVRRALEAAGTRVHVDLDTTGLDPEVDALLAWSVREAATNVLRHAGARSARVSLERDDGTLALVVEDDGRGPAGRPARPARDGGLDGLAQRLAVVGGTVEVTTAPSGGTRLVATVPDPGSARTAPTGPTAVAWG